MERERVRRRLAAILATGVAGYSRLVGADEEGTLAQFKLLHRELVAPRIVEHRGRVVKTTGDGLLAEFASVIDAIRCAVEVQRCMAERNAGVPQDKRIGFRIGIHQGDIIIERGDIFGDGVNVAARLQALAEPGGICMSARVQEDAQGKFPRLASTKRRSRSIRASPQPMAHSAPPRSASVVPRRHLLRFRWQFSSAPVIRC